jgi:CBS-domain-containing membrane protein
MANMRSIKELMVPLAEYATVSEDATLQQAFGALKKANTQLEPDKHRHRAVLVLDDKGRLIGKIGMMEVLRGLEPKYRQLVTPRQGLAHLGFTRRFIKSMLGHYNLWDEAIDDICRKAALQTVREFMVVPDESEYIEVTASLDEALHHLVMGPFQSLLVSEGPELVGILRLSDVFDEIDAAVQACPNG